MNQYGVTVAVICFLCIGVFHPIVIKAEYYFSSKCWPVFFMAGLLFLILSLVLDNNFVSIIFGILSCSCMWSIVELKEQTRRVEKGWFPKNPNRK